MTKNQALQKDLLENSDLKKKLKRSKSADDVASPSDPNIPLKKSHSQLEIPLTNQPSEKEQISQLKEQVKFQAQTSQNYLASLQLSQVKVIDLESNLGASQQTNRELADQILQLRLDKIKEFGDYWEKNKP